jgi:hypothetical protein
MRRVKGSRRIVVNGVEYRWRATGNDGYITVGVWPANNVGAFLCGTLRYHETAGDQIVVTNRIVRRVIEHAITQHGYDPAVKGKQLNLMNLEDVIAWDDAVRASDNPT